jgi:hypothetical protein
MSRKLDNEVSMEYNDVPQQCHMPISALKMTIDDPTMIILYIRAP